MNVYDSFCYRWPPSITIIDGENIFQLPVTILGVENVSQLPVTCVIGGENVLQLPVASNIGGENVFQMLVTGIIENVFQLPVIIIDGKKLFLWRVVDFHWHYW